MKTCSRCGFQKSLDEFYRARLGSLGRQARCKQCQAKHAREPEIREKARVAERKARHKREGWAPGEHERSEALRPSARRCACCGSCSPRRRSGFVADHNPKTGAFRAFLCHPCNIVVGFVETHGMDFGSDPATYIRSQA